MKNLLPKVFLVGFAAAYIYFPLKGYSQTSDVVEIHAEATPAPFINIAVNSQHMEVAVQEETLATPAPTTKPIPHSVKHVAEVVKSYNDMIFGEDHWEALQELLMRESGFKTEAQNKTSTAYGLFQFLDSTWKGVGCQKSSDVHEQVDCGLKYVRNRYGSPKKALEFHNKHNWY